MATHESPKSQVPRPTYTMGDAIPRYCAVAIPKLPRTSNARPAYSLTRPESWGREVMAMTASATPMEIADGTQRPRSLRNWRRAAGKNSCGRTPARKKATMYSRATARRRRTASASRSGGRLQDERPPGGGRAGPLGPEQRGMSLGVAGHAR